MATFQKTAVKMITIIYLDIVGAAFNVREKPGVTIGLVSRAHVDTQSGEKRNYPYVGKAPEIRIVIGGKHLRYNTGESLGR